MIQDVSQTLYKALSEKRAASELVTREVVESSDIPASVRTYLLAVLEREAERVADAINNRRDVWVAESVDVRRARTALAVAASRNVQLPPDRADEIVLKACDTVVRYLVRPSATLQATIFDRAEHSLDVEEILERMRMFSAYPYFQEVLRHYFSEKEIEHVDRARLDSVLHRIDRQMTSDFTPEEWMQMLSPLYETLEHAPGYREGVPSELLRTYFREKELGAVLLRLDGIPPTDLVSKEELLALLEAPEVIPEEVPAEDRPVSTQREAPAPARAPQQESAATSPEEDAMVPLWKQFQHSGAASPPPKRADDPPKKQEPGRPIWQQFRPDPAAGSKPLPQVQTSPPNQERRDDPLPKKPAPTPEKRGVGQRELYPDIQRPEREKPEQAATQTPSSTALDDVERGVLGDRGTRSRQMFVRQLFAGSEKDYQAALERIAETRSWADASRVIARDVFRRFDVNIYDEAAVAFTELVEARFEQQRSR